MKPVWLIRQFLWNLFYFILPNLRFILLKRIKVTKYPRCQQRVYLSGKGQFIIGKDCHFGYIYGGFNKFGTIELQTALENAIIKFGSNISTNNNICISAANYIEIGDESLIGQNVTIMDFEAHGISPLQRHEMGTIGKVIIGKNIWIGNNVTILKNTVIGENSIVATGAVVSGKFPANVVIGGIPAKVIKKI